MGVLGTPFKEEIEEAPALAVSKSRDGHGFHITDAGDEVCKNLEILQQKGFIKNLSIGGRAGHSVNGDLGVRLGESERGSALSDDAFPSCITRRFKLATLIVVFVLLGLAEGFYCIFNIGPLTTPDSNMHCVASYALATGQSLSPEITIHEDSGGNDVRCQKVVGDSAFLSLPGVWGDLVCNIVGLDLSVSEEAVYAREQQIIGGLELSGQTVVLNESALEARPNQYSPVGYIPQALGMKVGMLLDASPYGVWQWGRAANLAFYLLVCSIAIAILPRMRLLLVFLALIPTNIFCASSLMTNSTSFAFAALLTVMTIRAIVADRRLTTPECLAFAVVAAITTFVKPIYLPLFLPALLMPKLRENKRGFVLAVCIVAFAIVFYLAWSKSCGLEFVLPGLDYEANRGIFFGDFPTMLLWAVSQSLVLGSYFSSLPSEYHALAFAIATGVLIYVTWNLYRTRRRMAPSKRIKLQFRYVIAALVSAFIVVATTFVFMLLTWNDLSQLSPFNVISGIQGRYFLPLLPLLLFVQTLWRDDQAETSISKDLRSTNY